MPRSILTALVIVIYCGSANAIIRRHDKDPAEYARLGQKYADVVGDVGGHVACTLIAPRWALGAGHTMEDYFNPAGRPTVTFAGRTYDIDKIIIHPRRVLRAVDSSADLLLLRLAEPVRGVTPVELYDSDDEPEQIVTLVGRGATGTGLDNACGTGPRGTLWGAHNRVDAVFEGSLVITFDAPPLGQELEGISGAGDSGCPALLEKDGRLFTLGVGSFNSGIEDSTECGYGTIDAFARVSTHRAWILETIAADPPSTVPLFGPFSPAKTAAQLPGTPAAKAAAALVAAFNSANVESIRAFYREFGRRRTEEELTKAAAQWPPLIEEYGKYEIRGYAQAGPYDFALFVHAEKPKIGRVIGVSVEPEGEHRVARMRMADSELPGQAKK